jgi:hypothetical protein
VELAFPLLCLGAFLPEEAFFVAIGDASSLAVIYAHPGTSRKSEEHRVYKPDAEKKTAASLALGDNHLGHVSPEELYHLGPRDILLSAGINPSPLKGGVIRPVAPVEAVLPYYILR